MFALPSRLARSRARYPMRETEPTRVLGSGSLEDASPFHIIAMEEEVQTSIMHK